jgi:hypothetical protein
LCGKRRVADGGGNLQRLGIRKSKGKEKSRNDGTRVGRISDLGAWLAGVWCCYIPVSEVIHYGFNPLYEQCTTM